MRTEARRKARKYDPEDNIASCAHCRRFLEGSRRRPEGCLYTEASGDRLADRMSMGGATRDRKARFLFSPKDMSVGLLQSAKPSPAGAGATDVAETDH